MCVHCGVALPHGASTPRPASEFDHTQLPGASGPADGDVTTYPAPRTAAPSANTPRTAAPPAGESAPSAPSTRHAGPLAPGASFGRYSVIKLLGAGGMGAVYQAWDNELGVAVALKVIRPEVMADPSAERDLERRFKRELLLARQVTHKNVVRIHDLGEIDGIKYITMPYIEGSDLASCLQREGRMPVARVLAIARDVAAGLLAAHEAGVVHRDLKPANVMIDTDGHAIIMDFGIARSASAAGTVAGAVVGTLEYMAPEQAMGHPVDQRADIYAFGLILYDLLLGRRHASRAESAVAELMQRMHQVLPPLRSVAPELPEALDALVARCVEPDPAQRFQSTAELVEALEHLDASGQASDARWRESAVRRPSTVLPPFPSYVGTQPVAAQPAPPPRRRSRWILPAAAAVTLVAGAGGWLILQRTPQEPPAASAAVAPGRTTSMTILPFRNVSADPALDWVGASLADLLQASVSRAGAVRATTPERVHQVLRDLRIPPGGEIDGPSVRRIADFSSAEHLLVGSYASAGGQLRIEASVRDGRTGAARPLPPVSVAPQQLHEAVSALAAGIHGMVAAGGAPAPLAPSPPSTQSAEALRHFTEGVQSGRAGNHIEARRHFEAAVAADPAFALAHARLAQTLANLGHDNEAEQASRRALDVAGGLPERERFVVEAVHARILNDQPRAIRAYRSLLAASPADPQVQFDLGGRYEATGAFDEAREQYLKVIEADPKYLDALFAMGRVEIQRQNPQDALEYLNRALSVAIQVDNDEARASMLNAIGIAYKRLDKPADALRYYTESLDIRRRIGDKRGVAATLSELGQIEDRLGRRPAALQRYAESLDIRRAIGDRTGVANTLNDIGSLHDGAEEYDKALQYYQQALQAQAEVGNEHYEAMCLQNIGSVHFAQGRYEDAATYFSRALPIRERLKVPNETADVVFSLAEIARRRGAFDAALEGYVKALGLWREAGDRRGVAVATAGTGTLFDEQGRYGAALDALREAVQGFEAIGDTSRPYVDALGAYGRQLAVVGRFDEGRQALARAAEAAKKTGARRVAAQVSLFEAETYLLEGPTARTAAALATAITQARASGDRYLETAARLQAARLQLQQGRAAAAASALPQIEATARGLGARPLAADAALSLGEALAAGTPSPKARTVLEEALREAERLGVRLLQVRAHHALARLLARTGDASAERHAQQAARVLGDLQKDAHSDAFMKRVDLAAIARTDAARLAQRPSN